MTIKDFSELCGCNPQTLRYYDREGLLKPAEVDGWTGYRRYDEAQAVDFVKIKNLRRAGFTIGEIKALLGKDDGAVRAAFDAKIAEAEERLREMKDVRKSYQTEMEKMLDKIGAVREKVTAAMRAFDPREEFGIDRERYAALVERVTGCFEELSAEGLGELELDLGEVERGFGEAGREAAAPNGREDFLALRDDPDYETVYEKRGWEHVREFLGEFTELENGGDYALVFDLDAAHAGDEARCMAFMNTMLGILLEENKGKKLELKCDVTDAADGVNAFRLLKRK